MLLRSPRGLEEKGLAASPDALPCLCRLADLHRLPGKPSEAEPLYQRALALAERVLGPEHLATGECLEGLSVVCERPGCPLGLNLPRLPIRPAGE